MLNTQRAPYTATPTVKKKKRKKEKGEATLSQLAQNEPTSQPASHPPARRMIFSLLIFAQNNSRLLSFFIHPSKILISLPALSRCSLQWKASASTDSCCCCSWCTTLLPPTRTEKKERERGIISHALSHSSPILLLRLPPNRSLKDNYPGDYCSTIAELVRWRFPNLLQQLTTTLLMRLVTTVHYSFHRLWSGTFNWGGCSVMMMWYLFSISFHTCSTSAAFPRWRRQPRFVYCLFPPLTTGADSNINLTTSPSLFFSPSFSSSQASSGSSSSAKSPKTTKTTKSAKSTKSKYMQIDEDQLRYAFQMIDNKKDGKVNASQMKQMLVSIGIDVPERLISKIIREASKDG